MSGPDERPYILESNDDALEVRHGEYQASGIGVRVFVWRIDADTLRVTLMGIAESCVFEVTADHIKKLKD